MDGIRCTERELFVFKKIAQAAAEMQHALLMSLADLSVTRSWPRPTKDADIVCVGDGIELANKVADRFQPRP